MTIKVYSAEAKAGLSDQIQKQNVIAYCTEAKVHNKESKSDTDKALAQNENQKDLFYLDSILVSTGWNKNDDVFVPQEVWASRTTPEDKQLNLNHDETLIVGHITKNTSVLFNGEVITAEDVPEEFEILISSVLYTRWTNPEIRQQVINTVDEIKANKKSVSMECLFADFDYAVEVDGETKIISRDEESAFLTGHLRAYGGEGQFEGYKIGRALKNITFSGVGLVDNPANPRSVIKSGHFQTASVNDIFKQEKKMSEEVKAELVEAQAKLVKAETALSEATNKITSKDVLIDELKASVAEKDEAITKLEADLTASKAKVDEFEAVIVTANRKNQLAEIGIKSDEADAMIEKFKNVDDETFAEIVAIKAESKKPMDDEEDDEEDDSKATSLDDTELEAEASDDLGVGDESETKLLAQTRDWFKSQIDKQTKKETK